MSVRFQTGIKLGRHSRSASLFQGPDSIRGGSKLITKIHPSDPSDCRYNVPSYLPSPPCHHGFLAMVGNVLELRTEKA